MSRLSLLYVTALSTLFQGLPGLIPCTPRARGPAARWLLPAIMAPAVSARGRSPPFLRSCLVLATVPWCIKIVQSPTMRAAARQPRPCRMRACKDGVCACTTAGIILKCAVDALLAAGRQRAPPMFHGRRCPKRPTRQPCVRHPHGDCMHVPPPRGPPHPFAALGAAFSNALQLRPGRLLSPQGFRPAAPVLPLPTGELVARATAYWPFVRAYFRASVPHASTPPTTHFVPFRSWRRRPSRTATSRLSSATDSSHQNRRPHGRRARAAWVRGRRNSQPGPRPCPCPHPMPTLRWP